MADTSKQLGQRIRELRKLKGLTQEQLGDSSGVGSKYISQVERTGANVTLALAENIAAGLHVDLKDLFDFDHKAEEKKLRDELTAMIQEADGEQLQTLHRVIRAILV